MNVEEDNPDSLLDILDDETLDIVDGKSPNPSPSPPDKSEKVGTNILDSVELVILYGPPCSVSSAQFERTGSNTSIDSHILMM
jgi:hypothetical protein